MSPTLSHHLGIGNLRPPAVRTINPIKLWDFQENSIESIRELMRAGKKRILLVQPTGSGKGTIASFIIHGASSKGKRVVFLVNRKELVKDLSKRLDRLDIDHGIIMGNHPRRRPWLPVHVASIDTLHRRSTVPEADLIFVDEAHFSVSPVWRKVLDRYPNAIVIGMTATPIRADGRGLGEIYQSMVLGPSVPELIERGYLVPFRTFAPDKPDLHDVDTTAGDYNVKQLSAACDKPKLVGDIVEHWKRLASDRKTVAFGVDKAHAQHITESFHAAGIEWAYVDCDTDDGERDRIWDNLDNGTLRGVSSVGVISYGWDHPIVSCVIQARPTQSLALHLQQLGRGLRIDPKSGKKDLLILDHAGNTAQHGFADDPQDWSLDGARKKKRKSEDDFVAPSVRMCKRCWMAYSSRLDRCPACGFAYEKTQREIEQEEGSLQEITPELRCTNCHRSFDGVKQGDSCPYCRRGYMKRPYQIKKLSANPIVAKLQLEAQEKGYAHTWVWRQLEIMRTRGRAVAG